MKKNIFLIVPFIILYAVPAFCDADVNDNKTQEVSMKILDNGLKVIVKQNNANQIFAAVCMIDTGLFFEETTKVGITNFVQRMLQKGTKTRTAEQIADTIESVGGFISASASADFAEASVVSLVDDYELSLEMLSDVLFNPIFPNDEIEKERKLILDHMRLEEDDTFEYTYKNFLDTLYAGHNYQYMSEGTPETVKSIQTQDLIDYHKKFYVPSNMIISVVSNIPAEQAFKTIQKYFGQKSPAKPAKISVSKDFEIKAKNKTLNKKVQQGFLTFGYITAPVTSDDYPAIKVINSVLGEGMSSRLFVELRDKKGLAYAVGSIAPSRKDKGHILGYIGTKPETLEESKTEMERVFNELIEKEIPEDELNRCKNYIAGRFLMDHERNVRQAWYLAWFEIMGKGYQFDEKYPEAIKNVTPKDIMKVANKYFLAPTTVMLKPE